VICLRPFLGGSPFGRRFRLPPTGFRNPLLDVSSLSPRISLLVRYYSGTGQSLPSPFPPALLQSMFDFFTVCAERGVTSGLVLHVTIATQGVDPGP